MKRFLILVALFFRPASLDFASMGAGINGGLMDMVNAQSIPHANFNVPGNAIGMDQLWNEAMTAMQSATDRNTGMVDPSIVQAYSKMLGIDPSILVQAGSSAGDQYSGLSDLSQIFSGAMGQQAGQQFSAGQNIYNMGADPQNQLHDYMKSQALDSARSADSSRGIAMSPYSAGNESNAMNQFEMGWQNQQLGRGLAGLQGMNQANAQGAMDLSGSMNFAQAAPGYTMQSAMTPISAQANAYSMPIDFANMFTQAENQNVIGPQASLQNQSFPYVQLGDQAQQAQFNATMARTLGYNTMQQQAQYGLSGGGQSGTPYMQGNQSGAGDPMNWMGMGGGMGGLGGG